MRRRFLLAVTVAGVAQVVVFLRVGDWIGITAAFALAYLMLAAAGAGYFAGGGSAFAGFLSVIVGAVAYEAVASVMRTGGSDPLTLIGWGARLIFAVLPYAAGGAFAGYLGGRLRGRMRAA